MNPIYAGTLLTVLLAPLSLLQAVESPAPLANPERMPAFSGDRVPLYVHIRKDNPPSSCALTHHFSLGETLVRIMIVKNSGHNWRKVDAAIEPSRVEIIRATVEFFVGQANPQK
jgi:hypothetical protein